MSLRVTWPIMVLGWIWPIVALWPCSDAGWDAWWQVVLIPTGLIIGVIWCRHTLTLRNVKIGWTRWLWALIPVAWVTVLVLGATNCGLAFRVWLCEDELRNFVEVVKSKDESVHVGSRPKSVGTFRVQVMCSIDSEVNLRTARAFFGSYGISYWSNGAPLGHGYRHLYGPWYCYFDDF
jgi:hypothetical protein